MKLRFHWSKVADITSLIYFGNLIHVSVYYIFLIMMNSSYSVERKEKTTQPPESYFRPSEDLLNNPLSKSTRESV